MFIIFIIFVFVNNYVMGVDGILFWILFYDWENFKVVIKGKVFLMGCKSFEFEDYLGLDYKNFIFICNF